MKPQRRANAEKMLQSLQEHHDALEVLHAEWSNYDDVTTLSTLEQALSDVDVTSSDAEDSAKLVVQFVNASIEPK